MKKYVGYVHESGTGEILETTKAYLSEDAAWYAVAAKRMYMYNEDELGILSLEIDVEEEK